MMTSPKQGLVLVRGDVSVPKLTRPEGLHLIQLLKTLSCADRDGRLLQQPARRVRRDGSPEHVPAVG